MYLCLQPRNIFLSGDGLHVKIGDFGLVKDIEGESDVIYLPSKKNSKILKLSITFFYIRKIIVAVISLKT